MMFVTPTDNDVLFGRGKTIDVHPGNQRLRSLVREYKPQFLAAKRLDKRSVAYNVVEEVHALGGRFLVLADTVKSDNQKEAVLHGTWKCVDREKAVGKVMHRLREKDHGEGLMRTSPDITQQSSSLSPGLPVEQQPISQDAIAKAQIADRIINSSISSGGDGDSKVPQQQHLTSTNGFVNGTGNKQQYSNSSSTFPKLPEKSLSCDPDQEEPLPFDYQHGMLEDDDNNNWGDFWENLLEGDHANGTESEPKEGGDLNYTACNSTTQQTQGEKGLVDDLLQESLHANSAGSSQLVQGRHVHQNPNSSPGSVELPDNQLNNFKSDGQEKTLLFDYPHGMVQNNENNHWDDFLEKNIYKVNGANGTENEAKQVGGNLSHTVQTSKQPALGSLAAVNNNPSDSVFISILEWIHAAKKLPQNDYIQSAVNLACLLTKRLYELSTSMETQVLRVKATNVSINVKLSHNEALQNGQSPMINEVNIQLTGLDTMSSFTSAKKRQLECVSLGNILLEVFSKGESRSVEFSEDNKVGGTSVNDGADGEYGMPSISKRMASISMDTSMKSRATKLLLELGMPLSICRLVGDLLDAVNTKISPKNPGAAITLDQALLDLVQMRDNSQMFLVDRTSPQQALDDTHLYDNLDGKLFGREEEIGTLMKAKSNISGCVGSTTQGGGFRCEAIFLGGYAGSGKSCLLRSLINACEEEQWFVLKCKFDKKAAPLKMLYKAFDDFFGQWNSTSSGLNSQRDQTMMKSFSQICRTIFSTFDYSSLGQLCEMIPNLAQIFPLGASAARDQSLSGAVGSAEQCFLFMFHLLVKALCSAGRPVLLALDDLQWCDSIAMKGISDIIVNHADVESTGKQGLLVAGTYRNNELEERGGIFQNISHIKTSGESNVAMISADGLPVGCISQLLSAKLGLPLRYTHYLAEIVHQKSSGNPFFIIQFLKTIIHNKMLNFSVRTRRWTWDCDTIDFLMISDGVAELLTSTFNRLSANLLQTLKLLSCFGCQIEAPTIAQINLNQQILNFDIFDEIEFAIREGMLEKAGPLYQFTHDLIHQTLYDQIPSGNRRILHKTIGESLLSSAVSDDTIHLLAVDQINMFCKDGNPNLEERSNYAQANATAAKLAIAASSFEKARSYIDVGISLLESGHWEDQYTLSLDLYEMSASLYLMCGNSSKMSSCLDEIMVHTTSFEDSLNARWLLVRLLTSSTKHSEAISNCLDVLQQLGEEVSAETNHAMIQTIISDAKSLFMQLTVEQIKSLPPMTDKTKLQSMRFMSMLSSVCFMASPLLLPQLSVRMLKLTVQFGFCEDSVLGLFFAAYSVFVFTDDLCMAHRLGKIGEVLREGCPNKHFLRSRVSREWEASIKPMIEPAQAVVSLFPSLHESAMMVGDVESAMFCRYSYCIVSFVIGDDLTSLSKHYALCIQQMIKHKQDAILHIVMASYRAFVRVSGEGDIDGIKSFDELAEIGKKSNNVLLLFQVAMGRIFELFWFGEYMQILKICEKLPTNHKRVLDVMRCFFEGIAALHIARKQPSEPKWKVIGEKAVEHMSKVATVNSWTFENKYLLLKSELHYLNGECKSAEESYLASIKSAKDHKFLHEEALANELFGMFCTENQMNDKGMKHLRTALQKYKQWGATNKAVALQQFMEDKSKVM